MLQGLWSIIESPLYRNIIDIHNVILYKYLDETNGM